MRTCRLCGARATIITTFLTKKIRWLALRFTNPKKLSNSVSPMNKDDKTINRLTITTHDTEDCKRFLQELSHQGYGTTPYEALLIAAIIFYSRPFTGNERDKHAKANSKVAIEELLKLTKEEMKLHKKILELRNKAIAHSEWTYHPTRMNDNGITMSMPFSIWNHTNRDIEAFLNLADKVWRAAQCLIPVRPQSRGKKS